MCCSNNIKVYQSEMLKMLFEVVFFCSIVIVTGSQLSYTKESFSLNKVPCMTDCINNSCVLGFSKITGICNPGTTPGLQYYTARDRTPNKLCQSRCGKFDKSPDDWCYVSDNEWDYCNPEMGIRIVKHKAFTSSKGPCKDECKYIDSMIYMWCYTYWGSWDECDSEGFTYMQTKTRQGLDCVGICGPHEKIKYNWCYGTDEKEGRCAPIARNFSLINNMFDQVSVLKEKDSCYIETDQQNYTLVFRKHNAVPSGFVSRHATLLEYPNIGLFTENLNEDGNAINRYTIMPYALEGDPALPLVVRARITPKTLVNHGSRLGTIFPYRVSLNLQRMGAYIDGREYRNYEDGNIISYMLGGPGAVYNFAPQTQRSRNRRGLPSVWHDTEVTIRDFIVGTNGWAEVTVIVIYSDLLKSWKPDGYAVDFTLYNYDNTLYRECKDYYYSNYLVNGDS